MKWKALAIAVLVAMLVVMNLVLGESVDISGVQVPLWAVVFISYVLGVLALYAQLRSEDRVAPRRRRS